MRRLLLVICFIVSMTYAKVHKVKSSSSISSDSILTPSAKLFNNSKPKDRLVTVKHGQPLNFVKRNAFTDPDRLWPEGKVPFVFDDNVPAFSKIEIMAAMQEIEMSTYSNGGLCVSFVPRNSESDYIHITWTSATHGSTSLGKVGGKQELIINTAGGRGHDDNLNVLMSVLGLLPEVMRSDRDQYLTINFNNIANTQLFQTLNGHGTSTFGQAFDYKSLLMFTPYTGATDPATPSIKSKVSGQVLGQSVSLSAGDITLLQHTYTCTIDTSHRVDILGTLVLNCHFHSDICAFTQDHTDNFDWVVQAGPTSTYGTGPNADYSSGSGKFALAQARSHHNQVARLLSPQFPAGEFCFRINFHKYGSDVDTIRVYLKHSGGSEDMLNNSDSLRNTWYHSYLTIDSPVAFSIVIEATIGAGDRGDIAIDDVYMYRGQCIEWA